MESTEEGWHSTYNRNSASGAEVVSENAGEHLILNIRFTLFSDTRAAAVQWAIMKPEFRPPSFTCFQGDTHLCHPIGNDVHTRYTNEQQEHRNMVHDSIVPETLAGGSEKG